MKQKGLVKNVNATAQQSKSPSPALIALGVALIGVAGWAAWKAILFFLHALAASPAPVQAAVIAGSVTVFVSVFSLILSARYQTRREIQAEHRKQKSEIYEEFIKFWFAALMASKLGKEQLTEQEMGEYFTKFNQRMVVWGSDEVLREYAAFRERSSNVEALGAVGIMRSFETLLYAIRRDLGHANKNLNEKDLLRLFINDIDEFWLNPQQ